MGELEEGGPSDALVQSGKMEQHKERVGDFDGQEKMENARAKKRKNQRAKALPNCYPMPIPFEMIPGQRCFSLSDEEANSNIARFVAKDRVLDQGEDCNVTMKDRTKSNKIRLDGLVDVEIQLDERLSRGVSQSQFATARAEKTTTADSGDQLRSHTGMSISYITIHH